MPNYNQVNQIRSFQALEYYANHDFIIVSPVDLYKAGPFEVADLELMHLPLFAVNDEDAANDWISANVEYDGNIIAVSMRRFYIPYSESQHQSGSRLTFSLKPTKDSLRVTVMYPLFVTGKEAYWIGSHALDPKIYGGCGAAVSLHSNDFIVHFPDGRMHCGSSLVAVRNREEAELWFESRFTEQCTNIRPSSSIEYMPMIGNKILPVYLNHAY